MFVYQVPEYWLFADGKVWVVWSVTVDVEAPHGVVVMENILAVLRQLDLVVVLTCRLVRQNWIQDQVNLLAGLRAKLSIFPILKIKIFVWLRHLDLFKNSCLPLHVYNAWRRANQGLGIVWNANNIYIRYLVDFSSK